MKIINELIPENIAYALGWTVLHSLWQGIAIALFLFLGLHLLKNKNPKWQYEASCFALFSVLITALSTFIFYFDNKIIANAERVDESVLPETTVAILSSSQSTASLDSISMFEQYLPWVVSFWLIGVGLLTIRFFTNFIYLRYFCKQSVILGHIWQKKIESMRQKMKISRPVQLAESALAKTPMTLGFLKPIIIFPVGTLNQLSPSETEAILAHELAHIFRNDYLQNIFISIIEILFYYHPAVWWVSSRIHGLRENCCDDMAVKVCGDSVTYVKALVKLEDLKRLPVPQLVMSFSGRKNTLLSRVKRILNQGQPKSDFMEKIAATCLIVMLIFGLTVNANNNNEELTFPETDCGVIVEKNKDEICLEDDEAKFITVIQKIKGIDNGKDGKQNVLVIEYRRDTIPTKKTEESSEGYTIIESEKNNQEVAVEIRNNEIVFLEIDGREIPKADFSKYKNITDPVLANVNKEREHIVFPEDNEHFVFKEYDNGKTKVLISGGEGDEDGIEVLADGDHKIIINGKEIALPPEDFEGDFDLEDFEVHFDIDGLHEQIGNVEDLLGFEEERIQEMLDKIEVEHSVNIERITAEMEARLLEMKDRLEAEEELREAELERIEEEVERQAEALRIESENLHELDKKREEDERITEALEQELIRDGLIEDDGNYTIQLNRKRMKVNGEKQSATIRDKYILIIERLMGKAIDRDFNYNVRKRTRE